MLVSFFLQYIPVLRSLNIRLSVVVAVFGMAAFLFSAPVALAADQFSAVDEIQVSITDKKKEVDALKEKVEQLQKVLMRAVPKRLR